MTRASKPRLCEERSDAAISLMSAPDVHWQIQEIAATGRSRHPYLPRHLYILVHRARNDSVAGNRNAPPGGRNKYNGLVSRRIDNHEQHPDCLCESEILAPDILLLRCFSNQLPATAFQQGHRAAAHQLGVL